MLNKLIKLADHLDRIGLESEADYIDNLLNFKDKKAYTILHRFDFNLKRIIKKVGLGSRLGSFSVALALLLKEDSSYSKHKPQIEQAVIKWLKDTGEYENLLNECKDIPNISAFPIMTCFGMDIYERGNELVSEQEYERTII